MLPDANFMFTYHVFLEDEPAFMAILFMAF